MTKQTLNIQVPEEVLNETIESNELIIMHSDFITDDENSMNDVAVTQLLNKFPNELKTIAENESGFHMISENNLHEYIKHSILTESPNVEGIHFELREYFMNVLYNSFEKHFPNTFNNDYEILNYEILDNIAEFAKNELMKNNKLKINNVKTFIDFDYPNKISNINDEIKSNYGNNIHNVDWVEKYADSIK